MKTIFGIRLSTLAAALALSSAPGFAQEAAFAIPQNSPVGLLDLMGVQSQNVPLGVEFVGSAGTVVRYEISVCPEAALASCFEQYEITCSANDTCTSEGYDLREENNETYGRTLSQMSVTTEEVNGARYRRIRFKATEARLYGTERIAVRAFDPGTSSWGTAVLATPEAAAVRR